MSGHLSRHANPSKNRTPRHRAREFALQGLYQWLMSHEDAGVIDAYIRNAHGFDKADRSHFDVLLQARFETLPIYVPRSSRTLIVLSINSRQLNMRRC